MLEVLQFIFSDIWYFFGTCILLSIIFRVNLIKICKEDKSNKKDDSANEIGTYCDGCMFSYGSDYCINHCPKDVSKQEDN